jgi:hypothetical protein
MHVSLKLSHAVLPSLQHAETIALHFHTLNLHGMYIMLWAADHLCISWSDQQQHQHQHQLS